MNINIKEKFEELWKKYFGNSELPITFYYSDNDQATELAPKPGDWSCFICDLAKVRKGKSLAFTEETIGCGGGKRYLGFSDKLHPDFEYFLSCGNEQVEGERYLQSPELVKKFLKNAPKLPVKAEKIIFKRWDQLTAEDNPEVVIFFAKPDVLSGLFTLANYDNSDLHGTITPFGSGCASIVQYPYAECEKEIQKSVIGMFDVSARPYVQENIFTFALPMKRFEKIIGYMEESFLITESWSVVKSRINK